MIAAALRGSHLLCRKPGAQALLGKTLDEVARRGKKSPEDTLMTFVLADKAQKPAQSISWPAKKSSTGLSQPCGPSIGLGRR